MSLSSPFELRITGRCYRADLKVEPLSCSLAELAADYEIIKQFIGMRSQLPVGQETFRSATRSDIFTLHAGRHRGLTWLDKEYNVVWLLGFAPHTEGDRRDAYAVFAQLDSTHRLLPDAGDYEAFFRDRDRRQVPHMVIQMRSLLQQARSEPYESHTTLVADAVRVTLYVERVSDETATVEDLYLAVSARHLEHGWLDIIRTTLLPTHSAATWEYVRDFPNQGLNSTELRFRHWHELPAPLRELS